VDTTPIDEGSRRRQRAVTAVGSALLGLTFIAGCTHAGQTQGPSASSSAPTVSNPSEVKAIGDILDAFSDHPVVAIGEVHGSLVEHRFFTRLLEDPRTPLVVDDIVVEFGTARYQSVMDRFVDGQPVEEQDLRRVWSETTQTSDVWNQPVYRQFFQTVRDVNAYLPAERRLRVLLGDPPIDWSRLTSSPTCDDSDPSCPNYWLFRRDEHFASVVERESLAKGHHALLIAGIHHLTRAGPAGVTLLLDQRRPGATYVIVPHDAELLSSDAAERISEWPIPSFIPLDGSWLGNQTWQAHTGTVTCDGPDCEEDPPFPTSVRLADAADAYLYLGTSL
jgi:hypothetical protein